MIITRTGTDDGKPWEGRFNVTGKFAPPRALRVRPLDHFAHVAECFENIFGARCWRRLCRRIGGASEPEEMSPARLDQVYAIAFVAQHLADTANLRKVLMANAKRATPLPRKMKVTQATQYLMNARAKDKLVERAADALNNIEIGRLFTLDEDGDMAEVKNELVDRAFRASLAFAICGTRDKSGKTMDLDAATPEALNDLIFICS